MSAFTRKYSNRLIAFTKKHRKLLKSWIVFIASAFLLIELKLLFAVSNKQDLDDSESTVSQRVIIKNLNSKNTAEEKLVKGGGPRQAENENLRNSKDQVDLNLQDVLKPFVADSLGRVLNINFKSGAVDDSNDILNIVYSRAKHGVNFLDPSKKIPEPLAKRYVYVYDRYWEQLTMNTRVLMALASLAKLGGRFVVEPKVKDAIFGDSGYSFSTYYDVAQVNTVLKSNGYSTLVTQDEFDAECSINDQLHTILHFLYEDDKAFVFLKNKFDITRQQYDEISKKAKRSGWTVCERLKPSLSNCRVLCVDPTIITEWDALERDVLGGVKCLGIFVWRGIGFETRTSFSEKHVKVSSKEIHFLLKPSIPLLNEAAEFTKSYLSDGYIAVQVRGEKVMIQHNLTRLKKCLRLLVNVVDNVKQTFGISKVFLATDMSDFGSSSWSSSVKHKDVDAHSIKSIHTTLVTRIGAMVYKPSSGWQTPDRGAISLVELSIIAHGQHLLTVGTGSFQEWVVAKFLETHRDNSRDQWSLTRLCSSPW